MMEIIIVFLYIIMGLTSVSLLYLSYQLGQARKHLESAMKICQDAVESLRAGKG